MASALGMKRLRETPPEERLRNARRAVKRLRHETRYASCCFSMFSGWVGFLPKGKSHSKSPCLLGQIPSEKEASSGVPLAGFFLWPGRSI